MNTRRWMWAALLCIGSNASMALEVDPNVIPEINVGGRVVGTAEWARNVDAAGNADAESTLNVADSSLLLGFSKYLFTSRDYGYANIGIKSVEDGGDLPDAMYAHELLVGIGGPRYDVRIGRGRLPNTLLSFPTVRDDDLLDYAVVANGASNANAVEYQQFGGQLAGRYWVTPRVSGELALTARTQTDLGGAQIDASEINGAAFTVAYEIPEAAHVQRGVRYVGVLVDYQDWSRLGSSRADDSAALVAALNYNLGNNPEAEWMLDAQFIATQGNDVAALVDAYQRARAKSRAAVVALRYVHRPNLQTRWQGALNVAWKDYSDLKDAHSYAIAPSVAWRIGSGIDVLGQVMFTENGDALAAALGERRTRQALIGISFALDATFNETVGERGSILNYEHNMLDYGPAMGGH